MKVEIKWGSSDGLRAKRPRFECRQGQDDAC